MNEPNQRPIWPAGIDDDDLPERLWPDGDFPFAEDSAKEDPTTRLVSLSFITAALRRRARFWITFAVAGFVIGAALYELSPPAQKSTATIVLKDGPNEDPLVQIASDAALAKSNQVGQDVVSQLGLKQTVASFLTSYSVAQVAPQVLTITASAPAATDAATRANAVAAAFLKVRAQYSQLQEQQVEAGLNQQVKQAQANLTAVNNELSKLATADPPPTQATLKSLQNEQTSLENTLGQVQSDVVASTVSDRSMTKAKIEGTQVVNEALPVKASRLKTGGIYFGGGLLGGLAIGMGIVIIGALLSNRLRSRDDVAYALGVPVGISVGPLRKGRLPRIRGAKNRERDMGRVVEHLRHAVPGKSRDEPVGLAVVAVDDPQTVGEAVVTLARAYAAQGKKVVVADLSTGSHAARRLGAAQPGVHPVSAEGAGLTVAVPEAAEITPIGPLISNTSLVRLGRPSEAITGAASDADVVLALVTLDPSLGAEHVATWATDAVPVVTAARSKAVAIRSVGEMLRVAGTRLESAVLIDADKNDDTLGIWRAGAS